MRIFFIDIYLGDIGVVILGVLVMSVFIMQETHNLPDITVRLREDAKNVGIRNQRNAAAYKIHVAIIPLNVEYKLKTPGADTSHESPAENMINDAKDIVEFKNAGDVCDLPAHIHFQHSGKKMMIN